MKTTILGIILFSMAILSANAQRQNFNEILVKDKIGIGSLSTITGEMEIDDYLIISNQLSGSLDSHQYFFGDIDAWMTAHSAAASLTNNFHLYLNGNVSAEFESATGYANVKIEGASGSDSYLELQNGSTSEWSIGQDASDGGALHIVAGAGMVPASTKMEIEDDGQFSFGAARPSGESSVMFVQNAGGSSDAMRLYRPSNGTNAGSFVDFDFNNSASTMTTFARLVGRISGTSSTAGSEAGELQARVADGAGSVAIVGTFDKDGLDVIGEIQGSGDAGFGGTRPASDPYVLYVETGSGDAETIKVYRPSSSANAACFIDYALNDSGSNETVYARTLGRVESSTNGSELGEYQVRIMNGGSGLETRFEVNSTGANVVGALTVDNVEVDVPDFVFDGTDGKAPEKLAELEQFIRRHNHLPEFPSAKDKKAWSSIDMVGTDMKLLERCERLTLHILALEKRLSALENNNN